MSEYVHGYATREQQRLVAQAEFWRPLILERAALAPGTRLLEVGCGVGAVLAILGEAFPGVRLAGVDVSPEQLEYARRHLAERGVEAELTLGDATLLPYPDGSFDHVWIQWVLEHLGDPVAALREAHRVLAPGGTISVNEADYGRFHFVPETPELRAVFDAMEQAMAAHGHSDAGPQAAGWLTRAGFEIADPGERDYRFAGAEAVAPAANYVADVVEDLVPRLAQMPGAASEAVLTRGYEDLRGLADAPGRPEFGWRIHTVRARR